MSDYLFMLENRLAPEQIQTMHHVQQAAERAGARLFLAGGALRDLLGGFPIRDLDFTVEGPALKLARALDRRLFTLVATDESHQSAELRFQGSVRLEIAMCRTERYTKTGGAPEIARGTIQDDLRRRDFSINAIALSLSAASRGLLLDPTNGLADIERKELRTLHNYSFFDDPARLLRLIRFQARLQYTIEERTKTQYDSAREAAVEEYITPRSRLIELRQVAAEPDSAGAVKALSAAGLLTVFEPHLAGKKLDHALLTRLDKARHLMAQSGVAVNPFGPFLHGLTSNLSSAEKATLRSRSGMRGAEARSWTDLEARAKALQKTLTGKQGAMNSRVYRLLSAEDPALLLFLLTYGTQQPVREKIRNYLTKLRPLAGGITDQEIEALGVKRESAKFARLRETYIAAKLDNKLRTKADIARLLASA